MSDYMFMLESHLSAIQNSVVSEVQAGAARANVNLFLTGKHDFDNGLSFFSEAGVYNSRAYNACSQMPRVGHMGILNQKQIQDVMALLLDPASPVNK